MLNYQRVSRFFGGVSVFGAPALYLSSTLCIWRWLRSHENLAIGRHRLFSTDIWLLVESYPMKSREKWSKLVGGDSNMAGLWLSHHIGNVIIPTDELIFFIVPYIGNVIIPTDFQSIIFQRDSNHQPVPIKYIIEISHEIPGLSS